MILKIAATLSQDAAAEQDTSNQVNYLKFKGQSVLADKKARQHAIAQKKRGVNLAMMQRNLQAAKQTSTDRYGNA